MAQHRKIAVVLAATALVTGTLASAQATEPAYDMRERTRQIAFDPARFFDGPVADKPFMAIVYRGDDYGFPVYSIAVRKGCTQSDQGEARRNCGQRMIARMVRAPYDGVPARQRLRGAKLFAALEAQGVSGDDTLAAALDRYGLDWLEADVGTCQAAQDHLAKSEIPFFTEAPDRSDEERSIVLHADKITFDYRGHYLTHSRYQGMVEEGSAGAWANQFAQSLESCWKPATALKPWLRPTSAR